MDGVFLKLLNMSMAAGWLILAVIVVRLLLKKAPKWISCALWGIVAFRLICPFSLESPLSLIPSQEFLSAETVRFSREPAIDSGISYMDAAVNPALGKSFAPMPGASVNPLQVWMFFAGILWGIGLAGMISYALASAWRMRRRMREAVALQEQVFLCDQAASPFILGIVRPRIYLPSGMEEALRVPVLAHERAHLARKDHWWKPLAYLLLSVYWFHPLVWAGYLLFCRDLELACDEKVIRAMGLEERKAYSRALVACSLKKRIVSACPLAFGEVRIRERVKKILHYKKPGVWIVLAAAAACILMAVCFLTNPKKKGFDIGIRIPPGKESGFYFSDTEISPRRNHVTLSAGQGLGDTEVLLQPVETKAEREYRPEYLTPGMPVVLEVEKGGWYRVGVNMGNSTEEEIQVLVHVEDVEVRIEDRSAESGNEAGPDGINVPGEGDQDVGSGDGADTDVSTEGDWQAAVRTAILEENYSGRQADSDVACCDFVCLATVPDVSEPEGEVSKVTYYGWALYEAYRISKEGMDCTAGSHLPVALTFEQEEGNWQLTDYWKPREGSYFEPDVREKFPANIAEEGIHSQKYVLLQKQSCYRQAAAYSGLDTDAVIKGLLDTICEEPLPSSNPRDYIDAHIGEYRELLFYGSYTLEYGKTHVREQGEADLASAVLSLACQELSGQEETVSVPLK